MLYNLEVFHQARKQAIFTRQNVRRNIQLAEAICEKQSPKENLKTNNGCFFLTKHADGLLFQLKDS